MKSIKGKLILGFSLVLILLGLVAFTLGSSLAETNKRLAHLVNVSSRKVNLSNEILVAVLESGRHEKNIIMEKDPRKKDNFKKLIEKANDEIAAKVPELRELADGSGRLTLNEFDALWEDYQKHLDNIISLSYDGEEDRAFVISSGRGFTVRNSAVVMLQRLTEKNKAQMADDKARSDEDYESSLQMILSLVLLSLLIAGGIAYRIIKDITARISTISKEAEKIASREHTDEDPDGITDDEFRPVFESLISINRSFSDVTKHAFRVASGDYNADFTARSPRDILGTALHKMTLSLRTTTAENEKHSWLTLGQNQLSDKIRGDHDIETLGSNIISFICSYCNADIGAFYIAHTEDRILQRVAGHGYASNSDSDRPFSFSEGLIGRAATQQKTVQLDLPTDTDSRILSTFVDQKPRHLLILPFVFSGKTMGVIELGSLTPFTPVVIEFIEATLESIAIGVNSGVARMKIQQLLEETQLQSEELQSQQEELRQMNEELEEQAQSLKQQQEELQITNEELEEQTQALEMKNRDVELAKFDIEQKTKQLEISSKYKSEFLANMSHELRTPLNSLLILSRDLADNHRKNLTEEQVESAEIIYKSGNDLLSLINEVLDLSKIEAGKMSLNIASLNLREFADSLYKGFRMQAEHKKIKLSTHLEDNLPEYIATDIQRLDQVMKNLLSNALKFTENGAVEILIGAKDADTIAIHVKDTGIGIPEDKQQAVFEAFQQADGGTSRKYGGTGLGLSISRELVKLLRGELTVESKPGVGSTFTLTIPIKLNDDEIVETEQIATEENLRAEFINYPAIPDDRNDIHSEVKSLLIIEDDLSFAGILQKQARQKEFITLVAATGEDGLILAKRFKPTAIILDENLPGIKGRQVLNALKSDPGTAHIPVHIISANERSVNTIKSGAIEHITKPVSKKSLDDAFGRIENFISRKLKNLLIVEEDHISRETLCKLIGTGDVKCIEASTGAEALQYFRDYHIDCIVLDTKLKDMTGFELIYELEKISEGNMPPIIVYTDQELSKEQNEELQNYTETVIIKGSRSEDRLLDETALFLHKTTNAAPSKIKDDEPFNKDSQLTDKTVLLVDDDMRNIFALSKVLRDMGMKVVKADNGKTALKLLKETPAVDIVLMDIMMPEMDGYEAMRLIRQDRKYRSLPVIALTAKAMKEDKQKCIDAGANDYISKPVDVQRLLSLMRVWLSK